jgi:APA family basic amino acid/polyamine antiporter
MPTDDLRRVGAFTAACVLVSNAVGSGIFTTTGFQARDLGDPALILALWAVGGVLALAGAMSYAELGAALPRVGGEYVYLRRAFGPLWGFLSGWTSFTIGFSAAIAATAVGFAHYWIALFPAFAPVGTAAIALALVWALTGVHALGVERGGSFQRWITVAKIGGIGLLVLAAFASGRGDLAHLGAPETSGRAGFGTAAVALIFVLYSYSGWNAAGYIAGEIRDPGRSLPRVMIGGTLFVTVLYLAVNLAYFYALPVSALGADPVLPVAEKAARALLGEGAATAVVTVLCISIAGAASSMIWAGPRVYWAMADDGVAPGWLAATTNSGAPVRSILAQSAWITVLVLSGTFEQLVVYSGVALAVFSAAAVSTVIVLRQREPELPRPFRVAPYPWLPLAYVVASLWIAVHATLERPLESLASLGTVAAGIPFYFLLSRRERRRSAEREE